MPGSEMDGRLNAVLCALDKIEVGLCILDVKSTVVIKNSEAQRLLKSHRSIAVSDDNKFICSDSQLNLELRRVIQLIGSFGRANADLYDPVIIIRNKNDSKSLLIEVSALSGTAGPYNGEAELVLLMLVDLLRPKPLSIGRAISVYGLTDAEATICQLLIEGNTTSQMAVIRCVSVETVRSQIKSILRKTQCTRRVDLISRVFNLAPSIRL